MEAHVLNRCWLVRATLFLVLAWPLSAPAEEEGSVRDQAAAHHQRGIQLFREGNHREAAAEFERAEQLSHSRANIMNLARCYQELGENQPALRYIERYLQEPELPPESRERAEQIRQDLQATDEEEGGGEEGGGRSLAGPWALLGSGLALLLTGAVLDIVAYAQANTDHDANDPFASNGDYEDWRSGARSLAIAGDVLVGVGAAAAVGGLIWLLLARRSHSGQASTPRSIALSPTVGGGLMLSTNLSF